MYIWMLHKLLMFCLFYLDRAVYLLSAYSIHWRLQEHVFKVNILYGNRIESGTKPSQDKTHWTEPPQTKLFLNIGIPFAVFSYLGILQSIILGLLTMLIRPYNPTEHLIYQVLLKLVTLSPVSNLVWRQISFIYCISLILEECCPTLKLTN